MLRWCIPSFLELKSYRVKGTMPIERKRDDMEWKLYLCIGVFFGVIGLIGLGVLLVTQKPEMSREERTARLVVDRMRDEFAIKVQSNGKWNETGTNF